MSNRRARLALIVLLGAPIAAADWIEQRPAEDGWGVRHATYSLRVVDYEGKPVETTVSLSEEPPGLVRGRTVAQARSDADGRARFTGITSPRPLVVEVGGSYRLRPHTRFLRRLATGGSADLGASTLERNFIVSGVIYEEAEDGNRRLLPAYVLLSSDSSGGSVIRSGLELGAVFRHEHLDAQSMQIIIRPGDGRRGRQYAVPFAADPQRPHRHLLMTLPRVDSSDQSVRVEEAGWPAGVPDAALPGRIEGRAVTPDGRPIPRLRLQGNWRGVRGTQSVETDDDGRFSMTGDFPGDVVALVPWGPSYGVFHEPGPVEVEVETVRRLKLSVKGERVGRIDFAWLHGNEWLPIDPRVLRGNPRYATEQVLLRARVPGRIDRMVAYPPTGSTIELDYRSDKAHSLRVLHRGVPVPGAIIDVLDAAAPPRPGAVPWHERLAGGRLNRVAADADGRTTLAGDPAAHYVAQVYAPGYEPARVRWNADTETVVDLVAHDARVRFQGLDGGAQLAVTAAGSDSLVSLSQIPGDAPVVLRLAPGRYDATVEDRDGTVLRGRTLRARSGAQTVDMRADRRPRVVVRIPRSTPLDWFVSATRRTPPTGTVTREESRASGFLSPEFGSIIEADQPDPTTRVLALPGTGRWLVHANAGWEADLALFTEGDLQAEQVLDLALPRLDASLVGTPTFVRRDAPIHGFAGPRMLLLAASASASPWHILATSAGRELADTVDRSFTLDHLPPGEYRLFHHLADEEAWGGFEVSLASGKTTRVGRFGTRESGPWTVDVTDGAGHPVTGATLRIRDRLHEAWTRFVASDRSTAVYADNPIPAPPAVQLGGTPVTFDAVRAGWVELVLDDPAGPNRHYLRKAEPGRTLRLVVDQ